jgi:hypothetical protein
MTFCVCKGSTHLTASRGNKNILQLNCVEIVTPEQLDCILSKSMPTPINMTMQVWLNAISFYQSQQSSLVVRDITNSCHTGQSHLQPHKTHLRLRPVHMLLPLLLDAVVQEIKWIWIKVNPIVALSKRCKGGQKKSTTIPGAWVFLKKQIKKSVYTKEK